MIAKEEAITRFKEIVGAKGDLGQLADSQFIEHLAIFASWALRQAIFYTERKHQEGFRSTATNKSSILAHVEDENYIPIRPQPSEGTATITNNGDAAVSLAYQQAVQSDTGTVYILDEPVSDLAPEGSVTVAIKQLELSSISHTVTEVKAFYEILFEKDLSPKINEINVVVDEDAWTLAKKFQNVEADDEVYDEFYSHTDQVGVRFGNGIFGAIPSLGSIVEIDLWLTAGNTYLAAGQELSLVGEVLDAASNPVDLSIVTATAVTGGTPMEDKESIRKNLQYWPIYNDQLVWDGDYIFFIKRNVSNIVWINVWGEREAEEQAGALSLDFINTIFVSAYAVGGADISSQVLSPLNDQAKKINRRFQWVAPVHITFTVTITGKVNKSRNLNEVETEIAAILETYYGVDAEEKKAFLLKDAYAMIDETGFFDGAGEYFEIETTGQTSAAMLQHMVYIDIGSSTFSLEYL